MNFPTPEEMKQKVYSNHQITDEQKEELEMMIRHSMQAGHRDLMLNFNNNTIDPSSAFRFLRLMDYNVSYRVLEYGMLDRQTVIVKI